MIYIAMQFVEGGTLKHGRDRVFSAEEALRLLLPVARALGYAHARGIVHRDIKPSNVLLSEGNWPVLADFGLAQMAEASTKLTGTGVGMGTPAYMSPEQGQGAKVNARTDIYSLGIMLYEMVTGDVPFKADTPMAIVIKHLTAPMPMPRQVNPDVPKEIEEIILKATAKNPDDRYQTAEEMLAAMEKALAKLTAPKEKPAPKVKAEKVEKPAFQLKPVHIIAMIALILLVLGGVFGPRLVANLATTPTSTATVPPATKTPTPAPTATPTAIPLAWSRLNSGQFLPRDTITAIIVDPSDPEVIYVGTENAGIYKTIDGGLSWQPAQEGLASKSIGSLVIDVENPNILYASVIQGGVYKTEDGGTTWQAVNKGIEINGWEAVSIVVMDPNDSQHLFYTNGFAGGTGNPVIYETRNGGELWEQVMRSSCPRSAMDLVVHPNGTTLYAGAWEQDKQYEQAVCEGGVYKSEDGGISWENIGLRQEAIDFGGLTIDPRNGNWIYAFTSEGRLYGSTNGGMNWDLYCEDCKPLGMDLSGEIIIHSEGKLFRSTNGESQWRVLAIPEGGFFANVIAFSPRDDATFFLGGVGLIGTTDSGLNLATRNSGLGAGKYDLYMTSSNNAILYIKQKGFIYQSLDRGRTWEFFTGLFDALAFDSDGNTLYRLWNNEVSYSLDHGQTWINISPPRPYPRALGASLQSAGKIYVAYDGEAQIFYSLDKGSTWVEAVLTCANLDCEGWNHDFLPSGNQRQILSVVADRDVFLSRDDGATWVECPWQGTWTSDSLSPLAIDPTNSDRLILATNGEGISMTTGDCQSWQSINNGLGSLFVNSVAIDPNTPDTLYAGTDGGAYVSFDGGQTWGQINDGLLGATVVYSIVVDLESNVYAATPYGIFRLISK